MYRSIISLLVAVEAASGTGGKQDSRLLKHSDGKADIRGNP